MRIASLTEALRDSLNPKYTEPTHRLEASDYDDMLSDALSRMREAQAQQASLHVDYVTNKKRFSRMEEFKRRVERRLRGAN